MTTSADRQFPPASGDERSVLVGWLEWQRATVHRKVAGLHDQAAHERFIPSSLLTAAAIVSHLRWVEWHWFERSFLGVDPGGEEEINGGWVTGDAPVDELLHSYAAQCARSRRIVESHALDEPENYAPPGLPVVSLRWIVGHVLEETARHLGHLDLLREAVDGQRGY